MLCGYLRCQRTASCPVASVQPVVHDDDFHPMPQRLVLAHETLQAPVNIVTDVVGSNDDRITSAPALIELGILSTQSGS